MDDPGGQPFGLAPITLADKALFDNAFASLKQPTTDYSFANTFIWGSSLRLYWTALAGHLCVFANGTGDLTMLLPPVPLGPAAAASDAELRACLERSFEIMDGYNRRVGAEVSRSRIEYVSDELLERLNAVCGGGSAGAALSLSASPMSGDYVYDMARMIDLAGGALKSKRHARSKFLREFPRHRTEELHEQHVPACLELLRLWARRGAAATQPGELSPPHLGAEVLRRKDTLACELALHTWRALALRGLVLLVDDQLVGFTLGEQLSPTQASILVEKTHPEFDGAAQFIFSEFCRQCWRHLPECNAGDDWGIPSLRFTKGSYRPVRLLSKYTLTRQAAVAPAVPQDTPISAVGGR